MKRFVLQTVIFIAIGVALFFAYGSIRTHSLVGFPRTLYSAALVISLPAVAVAAVSAFWNRLLWSTIAGSVLVAVVFDTVLRMVAWPTLGIALSFCAIGAVAAAGSHWLSEKLLRRN